MTFKLMHERVRQTARDSVRKGEFTERGLARVTGVSQPHIHNVLKGVRALSTTLSDRLLYALKIQIADLVDDQLQHGQSFTPIPLLADRIGSGATEFRPENTRGRIWIPVHLAHAASHPVAALVGEDFKLPYGFAPGDLILIQTSEAQTGQFPDGGDAPEFAAQKIAVHLVQTAEGPRLRHIRRSGEQVYAATGPYLRTPSGWDPVPITHARPLCARVTWVSRQPVLPGRVSAPLIAEALRGKPRAFGGQHAAN